MKEKITAALLAIALVTSVTFVGLVGPAAAQTGYDVQIYEDDALVSSNGDTIQGSDVEIDTYNDAAITASNVSVVGNATGTTYSDQDTASSDFYVAAIPTADIGTAVGDSMAVDVLIDGQLEQTVTVSIASASVVEVDSVLSDDLSSATSIEVTYRTADVADGPLMGGTGGSQYEAELMFGEQFLAFVDIDTSTAGDTLTVDYVTGSVYDEFGALSSGVTDTLYVADSAATVAIDGTTVYDDGTTSSTADYTTTIDAPEIVDVGDATVPITVTTTGQAVTDGTVTAADVALEDGTGTTFTETTSSTNSDTLTVEYDIDTSAIGSAIGDSSMLYASVAGTTEASTTVELTDLTQWDVTIDPTSQDLVIEDGYQNDTFVDADVYGTGKSYVNLTDIKVDDGTVESTKMLYEDPDYPSVTWRIDEDDVGTQAGDTATYTVSYHGYSLGTFDVTLVDSSSSTTTDTTTNTTSNYTVDVTYPAEIDDTVDLANVTVTVNGTAVSDGTVTATDVELVANGTAYTATATNTTATDEIVIDYAINATDVGTVDGDTLALDVVVGGTVEQTIDIMFVEPVLGTSSGSTSNGLIILLGLLAVAGGGMLLARD